MKKFDPLSINGRRDVVLRYLNDLKIENQVLTGKGIVCIQGNSLLRNLSYKKQDCLSVRSRNL